MDLSTEVEVQRDRLQKTIGWARKLRRHLQPLLEAHGARVHFRPSSSGVAMVSVLADRPQRGQSGIRNLEDLSAKFEERFRRCTEVDQGRGTPEKEIQAFVIREARRQGGRLDLVLGIAGAAASEVLFVTDESLRPSTWPSRNWPGSTVLTRLQDRAPPRSQLP